MMTTINGSPIKKILPSQFMRELRPEYYSDTEEQVAYILEAPTLEYHLESITKRNQTHDFEIFCRKLCERTICPDLDPRQVQREVEIARQTLRHTLSLTKYHS